MALTPLNDLAKIELSEDEFGLGATKDDAGTSGILVALPHELTHYGFYSFAFDNSLLEKELLKALIDYWSQFIGKRVYWLALSEKGAILNEGGKRYAYVKLTSLIAWGEPEEEAESVLDQHGGSFSV